MNDIIRLPLDLLLVNDVETLEDALSSTYAIEHEAEIFFCKSIECLESYKEDFGENINYYKIDDIEIDRIKSVIDLLNMADENKILGHILDRMVR